ncbi:MAG: IclR family transcriptional regulator, partial [Tetrasphaera sp.]|nr:IclR family transcriptional regulator [Tetrasphaera sp.]
MWDFASRTPGALGLRELARPWMQAVQARVRQHTQLGVRSGTDVLFIDRLSDPDAVVNATLIGGRLPMPLSSSGVVLLAQADESALEDVVRAGWPQPTPHALPDARALRDLLATVRRRGYAALGGHIHPDSRGVTVPVLGPLGSVYAALSVVVPNDDAPVQRVVEVLKVAAAGIGRELRAADLPDGVV